MHVAVGGGRPGESLPCSRERDEGLASDGRDELRGVWCVRQLGREKEEMTQRRKMMSF